MVLMRYCSRYLTRNNPPPDRVITSAQGWLAKTFFPHPERTRRKPTRWDSFYLRDDRV